VCQSGAKRHGVAIIVQPGIGLFREPVFAPNMKLRIRSLPARGGDNPYVELFYDALEAHEVELVGPLELDLEWLAEHLDTFDAIHLHWPEHILARYAPPWLDRVRGVNIRGSWRVSKHLEHVFSS